MKTEKQIHEKMQESEHKQVQSNALVDTYIDALNWVLAEKDDEEKNNDSKNHSDKS